jgi:hypothetical protein
MGLGTRDPGFGTRNPELGFLVVVQFDFAAAVSACPGQVRARRLNGAMPQGGHKGRPYEKTTGVRRAPLQQTAPLPGFAFFPNPESRNRFLR